MALLPLIGHREARDRVLAAIGQDKMSSTLLLVGPQGIGKQRFALWIAQRLVCVGPPGEPCGICAPCRKVLNLGHADVHWFVPIARPKAGEPDKQVEEAAEALADLMSDRRQDPRWSGPDGMAIHGVASARLLLRRVAMTPVEARYKVFLVGDAERLIPQEANPEAANALLKVLEEPPADTVCILTASEPRRLLPTIRSRTVLLRLSRLADAEVREFLAGHAGLAGEELDQRVAGAEGSIGRALTADGTGERTRQTAVQLLEAALGGQGESLSLALRQNAWQARGEFSDTLAALADLLADLARVRSGGTPRQPLPAGLASQAGVGALGRGVERVEAARELAQGNVNPQLLLATLAGELEETLC